MWAEANRAQTSAPPTTLIHAARATPAARIAATRSTARFGSGFESAIAATIWGSQRAGQGGPASLEARIDGLALEGENPEAAFVDAPERFLAGESLESLDPECELPGGERPLRAEAA